MRLKIVTDEHEFDVRLYLIEDDGMVTDISEYPDSINEDENIIIDDTEYYLKLVEWDISNKPHFHEYELIEYVPDVIVAHDITKYIKS